METETEAPSEDEGDAMQIDELHFPKTGATSTSTGSTEESYPWIALRHGVSRREVGQVLHLDRRQAI